MEEEKTRTTEYKEEGPHSREVVEVYRGNWSREVVECYARPLPGAAHEEPPPQKKRKKGLWIFLILLLLSLLLAGGGWLWSRFGGFEDRRELPEHPLVELPQKTAEVRIPGYPYGEGAKLKVQRERGRTRAPRKSMRASTRRWSW